MPYYGSTKSGFTVEAVNGIIIGGDSSLYVFMSLDDPPVEYGREYFNNDFDAEEWVKANHPTEYAQGIEMRVWDEQARVQKGTA